MSNNDDSQQQHPPGEDVARCLVYCRCRPSKPQDFEDDAYQLLSLHGKRVSVKDERNYDFDGTFDGNSRQEELFDTIAKPSLDHTFKGFNTAILAYGQTGTGKSYTMIALSKASKGIIPRAADYIFEKVAADPARKYTVTAQMVQIYRDQLGDLMLEGGKEKVDIRFEEKEGVTLPGCTTTELSSAEHFMEFFSEGDKRRVVTATAMNPESSRGHTALVVRVGSEPADSSNCGARISGKITFIDLAGYERFSKTGISNANPIQKDEAKTINASLLSLGHVVTALSNNDKHIPWRNAKLTRLLQDSIGGRSRTSIILTVGPSSEHLHESTNTLQFGQRAMAVKVQARVTSSVDYEKLAAKLQELLNEKDKQISSLEIKLAESNAQREELLQRHGRDEDELRARQHAELRSLRESGASAEKILEVTNLFDVEIENLKEQQREELGYQQESAEQEMKALLDEQAKLTRRKEDEAKMREEARLKELEQKLAQARGGDSTADLERCLKQLAERDAVLVSRAGERARLQALCATLIQQVRQLGGTPTHGGEFDENFLDLIQVEEIKGLYEMQIEGLQNQSSDLRAQLERIQEVANSRANEVENLREELLFERVQLQQQEQQNVASAGVTIGAADGDSNNNNNNTNNANANGEQQRQLRVAGADSDDGTSSNSATSTAVPPLKFGIGGGGLLVGIPSIDLALAPVLPPPLTARSAASNATANNLVDRSEVETVRTLMQVDIDMLNCKVKVLEQQLAQVMNSGANAGDNILGMTATESVNALLDNNFDNSSQQLSNNQSFGNNNNNYCNISGADSQPPSTARSGNRRRAGTVRLGGAPEISLSSTLIPPIMTGGANNNNNNNNNFISNNNTLLVNDPDYRRELNDLRNKNLGFEGANVALHEHVKYLESLVEDLGGAAMPAPLQEETATIENVIKTAHDLSKAKSEELERLLALLDAREAVINDQAMQIGTLSEDSRRIREQFPQIVKEQQQQSALNGVCATSNANNDTSPSHLASQQHSQQIKQFVELIRAARSAQRTAEEKLFSLQNKTAAMKLNQIMSNGDTDGEMKSTNNFLPRTRHIDPASSSSSSSPSATSTEHKQLKQQEQDQEQEQEQLSQLLRQNDDRLLAAESRVIELESQNGSLKRMVAALEKQLEVAAMTPVCGLSKEDRAFIDLEREKDGAQARAAHDELQLQLQQHLKEKEKMQGMLDEMSKKRAQEAAVYSSIEHQLEEQKAEIQKKVEEDRKNSTNEMSRLQKIADEHAAEARRLKEALEERDRKEREAAEEAARVKQQLEEFTRQQRERDEEANTLRAQLQEKQKVSTDKNDEAEKLKKQLEENTREMMAAQARKQLAELDGDDKKSSPGFFERLKKWKI